MWERSFIIRLFYNSFPVEFGHPWRRIVWTKEELYSLINKTNGVNDVFVSVLGYARVKDTGSIDYESCILDRIYADLDVKDFDNDGNFLKKKVDEVEDFLNSRDILRVWVMSGEGFHSYFFISNDVKNPKNFTLNVHKYLSDKFGIKIDSKTFGRIDQIARVIGSYNPRKRRFCISLTRDDLKLSYDEIREKAKKSSSNIYILGKKLFKFDYSFDEESSGEDVVFQYGIVHEFSEDLSVLLNNLGILEEEIPICIKNLLGVEELGYDERYILIIFFLRAGLSKTEIEEVLRASKMSPKKFYHCTGLKKDNYVPTREEKRRVEHQIKFLCQKDYYLTCGYIRRFGLCSKLCKDRDVLKHLI